MSKIRFCKLYEFPEAQVLVRVSRDDERAVYQIIMETHVDKFAFTNAFEVEDEEHLDLAYMEHDREVAFAFFEEAKKDAGTSYPTTPIKKHNLN